MELRSGILPFVLLITACSQSSPTSSLTAPLPPIYVDEFTDSLTESIKVLGSSYSDCPVSRSDTAPNHAKHVALETTFHWCSNRLESLRLQDELVHLCFVSRGELSGDWCYHIESGAPLYRFSQVPSYVSALPDNDDEPIQWTTEVTTPTAGQLHSFDWLTYARSRGFLTQEQTAYAKIFEARLKKIESEKKLDENLIQLREQIQTHFANRKALQGQYGILACKRDDTYFTLDGELVGRVLSTFEHQVQIQLIEYRGFNGIPAQFEEGKVVIEDYANWKPCR